jgi:hypothetical protein
MRTNPKRLVVATLGAVLIGALIAGPTMAGPRRKPKPKKFTESGTIAAAGLVTHYDFLLNCPGAPATQGVDAYVVEVPADFQLEASTATADVTTSVSADPALEMSFYSVGCGQGELYVPSPATVPAGTGYIVVQDIQGGAVEFDLTLSQ